MLENMLRAKQMPVRLRVTVQGAVSLLVVALAVALPQLVHAVAGAEGGMRNALTTLEQLIAFFETSIAVVFISEA